MRGKTKNKAKETRKKLAGAHKLLFRTYTVLRLRFKVFIKIAALSTLVNLLLQLLLSVKISNLYQGLWFILTFCALIWTNRQLVEGKSTVTLREAFYEGSAPFLKFFLVSAMVSLTTLPFSIGTFLLLIVSRLAYGDIFPIFIIFLIWLLLAISSIVLLSRIILALIIVTNPGIRPVQSIKISWVLAKKRVSQIATWLGVFFCYSLIFIGLIVLLLSFTYISATLAFILLGFFANFVIAPIFTAYLYQCYRELS